MVVMRLDTSPNTMIEHDDHENLATEPQRRGRKSHGPWRLIPRPSPLACAGSRPSGNRVRRG